MTPSAPRPAGGTRRKGAAPRKSQTSRASSSRASSSEASSSEASSSRASAKKAVSRKTPAARKAAPSGPTARPTRKKSAGKTGRRVPPQPPKGHEVDPATLEFIAAIDAYKDAHGRPFPTWSEVLHLVHWLGYRKPGA